MPLATPATGKRSAIVKEGEFYYLSFEGRTPLPDSTARWSTVGSSPVSEVVGASPELLDVPLGDVPGGDVAVDGDENVHFRFSSSRISPMTIALSTALIMS